MLFYNKNIDQSKYFIATYWIVCAKGSNLTQASWELAIGQSVGNPNVRNAWETEEIFEKSSCIILHDKSELNHLNEGLVDIAFPIRNIDWETDGISQLLCHVMGGQMDIDKFIKCRLVNLKFPKAVKRFFLPPKYGIHGLRKLVAQRDKPFSGAIIKPKTGVNSDVLLDMVKLLVDGGVDFIKEDEILSNPDFCKIKDRVPKISKFLNSQNKKIIYAVCINGDHSHILNRAEQVADLGGNAIHVNHWCGLGVYNSLRKLDLPLFLHFQKSGDKIFTDKRHNFGIDFSVICSLAGLMGVDSMHAGMWGGYLSDDENELKHIINILHEYNTIPALSCGMHPGLVQVNARKFGNDFIANVGGAIHGHPLGTYGGALAMRQSIDKTHGIEYEQAIAKWGLKN